jgi:hypothetical protein
MCGGKSAICMAPFHVWSKVCIAPIHVRSRFADFAPHMDGSNADFAQHLEGSHADFAPHMEWRHRFRNQTIVKIANSANFCKEFLKTVNFYGVFMTYMTIFLVKLF